MEKQAKGRAISRLLISGGTLIDGTGAPPLPDAAVLIEGGRILDAGPSARVRRRPESDDADVLDGAGSWIIPGLIDAHVHTTLVGAEAMPVFLACGVTTVRDVGGHLQGLIAIREQLESGGLPGPRFIFSGPLIDGEVPSFPNAFLPIIQSTATPAEAADVAEGYLEKGAGAIKLYFRLPRQSVRAVIGRIGGRVPVTGHLGRTRASEAVEEGIDCFEHVIVSVYNDVAAESRRFDAMQASMADPAFWSGLLAGWAEADLDGPAAQRLLESMCEREVTLDPTLDITSSGMGDPQPGERDPNLRYVRATLVQMWDSWRAMRRDRPAADAEASRRGHGSCGEFVRRYHEMGGRVIAGTDVGAVPYLVPGFSLHGELRMLVDAGLAPAAALEAATIGAARALRIDAETGSVEAGKVADLVLLGGDPTRDITNLGKVRAIVKEGTAYHPETLLGEG